jgi:hypothetical protein
MACLILDQQVKLINGNEANLLIPQDWMKKYIEDQEKGIHQSEPQQSQTLIKSMYIIFSEKSCIFLVLFKVSKFHK